MRKAVIAVIAVSTCVGMVSLATTTALPRRQTGMDQIPTATISAIAIATMGLTPQSSVVAGCSLQEIDHMLDWLCATPSDEATTLAAALSAESTARTLLAQREAEARATGTGECLAALSSQRAEADAATAAVAQARAQLCEALDDEVGRPISAVLLRAQSAVTGGLPAEMGTVSLTGEEVQQLQLAVKAERRADRMGTTLDSPKAQLLNTMRGRSEVVAARDRLITMEAAAIAVFAEHGVQ